MPKKFIDVINCYLLKVASFVFPHGWQGATEKEQAHLSHTCASFQTAYDFMCV